MGFKRTPEGRVFFQGTDTANDESAPKLGGQKMGQQRPSNPSPQMRTPMTADKTQGQIVTLLKTLNERLKVTQADRDRMMGELDKHRHIIEDLEDKANRSEKLALDLEHKLETQGKKATADSAAPAIKELEETRRALAEMERSQSAHNKAVINKITKSSAGINALHKRIESTEAKQGVIDERVELALTEQAKITRKVDKAIEDRARFMRKIERIEETVIQTRDALNAKAMVVLTEQGVNSPSENINEGIAKYLPDDLEAQIEEAAKNAQRVADIKTPSKNTNADAGIYAKSKQEKAIWQNPSFYGALTGGLAFILAVAVISALALNDWKLPGSNQGAATTQVDSYYQSPQATAPVIASNETAAQNASTAQPIETIEWSVQQELEQQPATKPAEAENDTNNDVGTVDINDTEQVAALIDNNPQAVAEALNEIEPQKQAPIEKAIETPVAPAPQAAAPTVKIPATTQNPKEPNPTQAATLSDQLNRDPNLPNIIKKVEDQAYDGIGEAQHDLAAIYTAGHGGVNQNYDRAAFWFEKAAENGIANASYNLGVLHHQGLGFKPDVTKAMTWYQDAAAKGHPEAQYNLGIAYIEGIGLPYDPAIASNYFESAANNGVMEAAYNLGLIHENGLLGEAKPQSALHWYKTAADQGSPEAKQALNDLANNLGINADEVNRIADAMKESAVSGALQTPTTSSPASSDKESSVAPNFNDYSNTAADQGTVAQIQEYLMREGLYPGPADGVRGALTSDAIRSYQSRHNMETDGKASQNLLGHMLANANEAAVFQNAQELGSRE